MLPLQPHDAAKAMLQYLGSVYPLSEDLQKEILDNVQGVSVRKRKHLLKEGQICRNIYFVVKGLLRCYYFTDDGTEVSTWFMRETDTCVSVDSFYLQIPSYEYIRAEEDCELFYITYDQLQALYKKHLEFNYVGRVLTIKYLVDWNRQLKDIRLLKSDERYNALLKRDP